MSKLDKLLRELCPNGVEYKRIGDFAMCFPGATPKTTHPEYWENGTIPWMSSGEVNQEEVTFTEKKITQKGYDETSTKMVPVGTVVIALAGQGKTRGKVAITRIPLCTNQSLCAIVVDETVISKYLFHYLRSQYARIREISSGDGTRGGLNLKMIKAYVVPVPPIEVQEEIVRILDRYTEKKDELTQNLMTEITARNTQYGYYRDKLLKAETNAHKYKLGEIATVTKLAGFEFTNYVTYSENGNIIALRGLNVKNGRLDLHDVKYVDKSDFSKLERSKLHIGDMLFTYVGTVGQVAIVEEEDKYYLAPNVALIRCDKEVLLPQYMKYYFQTTQFWDKQIRRLLQSSSMQNIPMEKIRKFEIAVPPLDVQNRIVNVLDNFEKICADLNIGLPAEIEARQKQYEYYRDKLLTFAETGNTILSRAEQSRAEQSRAEQSRAEADCLRTNLHQEETLNCSHLEVTDGISPENENMQGFSSDRYCNGVFGVPITYLDKYNPEQFEIIGMLQSSTDEQAGIPNLRFYNSFREMRQDMSYTGASGGKANGNPVIKEKPKKGNFLYNEKTGEYVHSVYARIVIRRKL